ncbi:GntR family transcriptional regulator [Streptomyces mirabilis]
MTDRLRAQIVSGELKPGDKLRADLLARQWEVSPTPLREAFQRLAAEGLVTYVSQRGVRVTETSEQELHELYELRCLLEPWALERSAAALDDQARDEIRLRAQELDTWFKDPATFQPAHPDYERAHQAFHNSLIACCGSDWLIRLVGMLSAAATRYRNLSTPSTSAAAALARREHSNLAKLVLAGDVEQATAAQLAHLAGTQARVVKTFARSTPPEADR